MKKTIGLLLAMGIVVSATACSPGTQANTTTEEMAGTQMETEINSAERELNETETVTSAVAAVGGNQTEGMEQAENNSRVLIAYFSRWGNTDFADDVDATTSASIVADSAGRYGTTEYTANMIQELTGGEVYLIQTADKYPADFNQLVSENHDEMDQSVLPVLTGSPVNMENYDVLFIGYPIWATDAPQAVRSFLKEYDLTGKTVIPFCTHDGYGAGRSYTTIAELCPGAEVLDGLAIEAEDVPVARDTIKQWVEQLNASSRLSEGAAGAETQNGETAIRITIGDQVLDGILYDNAEARQFLAMLPQSVSMGGFGGREFYGGLDGEIQTEGDGQYSFENGHITYCPANNTAAIFYAQTDRPNLTMEVFPMGKVTSDLSVFDQLPGNVTITFSLAE